MTILTPNYVSDADQSPLTADRLNELLLPLVANSTDLSNRKDQLPVLDPNETGNINNEVTNQKNVMDGLTSQLQTSILRVNEINLQKEKDFAVRVEVYRANIYFYAHHKSELVANGVPFHTTRSHDGEYYGSWAGLPNSNRDAVIAAAYTARSLLERRNWDQLNTQATGAIFSVETYITGLNSAGRPHPDERHTPTRLARSMAVSANHHSGSVIKYKSLGLPASSGVHLHGTNNGWGVAPAGAATYPPYTRACGVQTIVVRSYR